MMILCYVRRGHRIRGRKGAGTEWPVTVKHYHGKSNYLAGRSTEFYTTKWHLVSYITEVHRSTDVPNQNQGVWRPCFTLQSSISSYDKKGFQKLKPLLKLFRCVAQYLFNDLNQIQSSVRIFYFFTFFVFHKGFPKVA